MLKGLGVLALALFIDGAFLAAITGPAAPARASRVEVGELAFAPEPAGDTARDVVVTVARQARRPGHASAR
jgi:hypothetical protein